MLKRVKIGSLSDLMLTALRDSHRPVTGGAGTAAIHRQILRYQIELKS